MRPTGVSESNWSNKKLSRQGQASSKRCYGVHLFRKLFLGADSTWLISQESLPKAWQSAVGAEGENSKEMLERRSS